MIVICCRTCLLRRQVASTRALQTGECPLCALEGRIEVGWVFEADLEKVRRERGRVELARRMDEQAAHDQLVDDLLYAALGHFETRLAPDARELRGAVASLYECLDEDGRL